MKKSRQRIGHLSSYLYNTAYSQFIVNKQIFISGLVRGISRDDILIDLKYTLKVDAKYTYTYEKT